MEPLVVLLAIITVALSILLIVVFVYVIMILRQLRVTIDHMNRTLSNSDRLLEAVAGPFENLGTTMTGLKNGLKFAEVFMQWLQEHSNDQKHLK